MRRARAIRSTRWPELELPSGCLDRIVWLERLAGRLGRSPQDADVRVMRHQIRRLRELVRETNALERELLLLVRGLQPRLLALPGVGPLTAAKLIAEIAGIERFAIQQSSLAWLGSRQFRPPAARGIGCGYTAAATVSSMPPFTASL